MPRFLVPADGQWHTLPGSPVTAIFGPLSVEVDLLPDGSGQVRVTDPAFIEAKRAVEIEYTVASPAAQIDPDSAAENSHPGQEEA
jgi:hypothetical protein